MSFHFVTNYKYMNTVRASHDIVAYNNLLLRACGPFEVFANNFNSLNRLLVVSASFLF